MRSNSWNLSTRIIHVNTSNNKLSKGLLKVSFVSLSSERQCVR